MISHTMPSMRLPLGLPTLLLAFVAAWTAAVHPLPAAQLAPSLRMIVQPGFLSDLPILVRVEIIGADGRPDWSVWDADVTLSTGEGGPVIVPSTISLRNGRGSGLVTLSSTEPSVTLTAHWNSLQAERTLLNLQDEPVTSVSGTLTGEQTEWSGVIRVTGDVVVPTGHALTVQPGTLVMIDGVASGTTAPDLLIQGRIESLGTEIAPVTLTCSQAGLNWGQIRHTDAEPSTYRYTSITRGGRTAGEGHTGTGPVIRPRGSTLRFDHCTLSDLTSGGNPIGKIMSSSGGSDITFDACILARARMGPEIDGTALLCTNTHVMNMFGPDDDDAIYIHSLNAGQRARVVDSVVAFMDDDGVDTLGAVVEVEDCLIRDVFDKGTSVFGAEVRIRNCLYADCGIGISSKANNGATVTTHISQTTIQARNRGIAAENKSGGSPNATVLYHVTNCIIRTTVQTDNSIYTDYNPANILISYSNLGESWPGVGNQTSNPMWVDPATHDFHLQPFSPCIDQGDPAVTPDPDGSRSDMGYDPFIPPPPRFSDLERLPDGTVRFLLHGYTNRLYHLDTTEDPAAGWSPWSSYFLETTPRWVEDNEANGTPMKFYRGSLGP